MAELPPFDPYHVLGVDKSADAITVKKAYRKLALAKHPDKCTDDALKQTRTDEFQLLNEAYDILGDDDKRKRHDALVKLDALKREKASMGGPPRPFQRSSTFHSGYSTGPIPAYTSRGPVNVEDRAPRFTSDDDDSPTYPRRYADFDYERRPPPSAARERTKTDREAEERRRGERRRDTGIREARSRKYDYPDEKTDSTRYDEEKRRRDRDDQPEEIIEKLRSKYADMEESVHRYTGVTGSTRSKPPMETRPSMGRRSSTREVPRPAAYVRRSQAPPKESSRSQSQRDVDAEQEILERERRKLREMQEKFDRVQEKKERERREREKDFEADRSNRDRRSQEREAPRPRQKENVEPYGRRPPTLQHATSSPPFGNTEPSRESFVRTRTEPPSSSPHMPSIPRSNTMPTVSSNSTSKRTPQPSKLRESTIPDSGYSSSSTAASDHKSKTPAKPVQRKYIYTRESSDDKLPRAEARAPRRTRSPSPDRPSSTAAKMVNLATRRPSVPHASSSSRAIPIRSGRSPDRGSRRERERGRERDYTRDSRDPPLYGEREREPQPTRDYARNVAYSKPFRPEDVIYASRLSSGRRERERDSYGFPQPGFQRSNSIPISAMSQ